MAARNVTPLHSDKHASLELRRAAAAVIKLYRDPTWDALCGESDGGYKELGELEEALGELETALDVATDTAEVLASRASETSDSGGASIESAKAEIRRQFEQAYALVTSAKQWLDLDDEPNLTATVLLDMAEDVLGDHEYINRIDPPSDSEKGGPS